MFVRVSSINFWDLMVMKLKNRIKHKSFGVSASLGAAKYQDLRSAIEQSYANNQAYGLLTTCDAFKQYKQC